MLPVPVPALVGIRRDADPARLRAAALTLLPVVLGGIGPRVDGRAARTSAPSRDWAAWARFVVRRKALAALVALACSRVLIVAACSA